MVIDGRSLSIVALLTIVTTVITVSSINLLPAVSRLYLIAAALFVICFTFLMVAFYRGLKIIPNPVHPKWEWFGLNFDLVPINDFSPDIGDGPIGLVTGILLWIVVSVGFILLVIIGASILWFSVLVVMGAFYWAFTRALRSALIYSRSTRGNLAKSTGYSLLFSVLYTGWIAIIQLLPVLVSSQWLANFA